MFDSHPLGNGSVIFNPPPPPLLFRMHLIIITQFRVCVIKSVDGTMITSFFVHECEGSSRMGSRPRRVLFTGHSNGVVQIWDLSTALDLSSKGEVSVVGGPTPSELLSSLEQCEVVASCASTPASTPNPAPMFHGSAKIKPTNLPILRQLQSQSVRSNDSRHEHPVEGECPSEQPL